MAVADVDLDAGYDYWTTGELHERYPTLKEAYLALRRPQTYGRQVQPDGPDPAWRIRRESAVGRDSAGHKPGSYR